MVHRISLIHRISFTTRLLEIHIFPSTLTTARVKLFIRPFLALPIQKGSGIQTICQCYLPRCLCCLLDWWFFPRKSSLVFGWHLRRAQVHGSTIEHSHCQWNTASEPFTATFCYAPSSYLDLQPLWDWLAVVAYSDARNKFKMTVFSWPNHSIPRSVISLAILDLHNVAQVSRPFPPCAGYCKRSALQNGKGLACETTLWQQ